MKFVRSTKRGVHAENPENFPVTTPMAQSPTRGSFATCKRGSLKRLSALITSRIERLTKRIRAVNTVWSGDSGRTRSGACPHSGLKSDEKKAVSTKVRAISRQKTAKHMLATAAIRFPSGCGGAWRDGH